MTSRMLPLGLRGRFCISLRARCSGPNRDWHRSCTCMRVVLQGCAPCVPLDSLGSACAKGRLWVRVTLFKSVCMHAA